MLYILFPVTQMSLWCSPQGCAPMPSHRERVPGAGVGLGTPGLADFSRTSLVLIRNAGEE